MQRLFARCLVQRLLLLMSTTTYKAEAFLAAAGRLGLATVVGTDRPQALAALDPQGNLDLPFAFPQAAVDRVRHFAARFPIDAVLAADDEGVVLAAHVARALGLAHNPVAAVETARNKLDTRRALQSAALPTPHFACFPIDADPGRLATEIEFPCVVKALTLSGSRGVIRADDPVAFVAAFERVREILAHPDLEARAATAILVEDYLPGVEIALEGLIENHRLRSLALFDKPDPLEGPFFEETLYVTPSRHPLALQAAVVDSVQRAVTAIGLHTGPVHAEVRVNDRGVFLLEAAPRSIGGLCSRALRFGADGSSLEELLLHHALGHDTGAIVRERTASGVMMIPIPRAGILREVGGIEAARAVPHIDEVRISAARGQPLAPPPEGSRYLGFIFARAPTADAVETALRASHGRLRIDIDPAVDGAPPEASARPVSTLERSER